VEPPRAASVAAAFFHLLGTTDRKSREPPRFFRRCTARHQIRRMLLEMELDLRIELRFHLSAFPESLPPGHFWSPSLDASYFYI
jgi:hypothetical protein